MKIEGGRFEPPTPFRSPDSPDWWCDTCEWEFRAIGDENGIRCPGCGKTPKLSSALLPGGDVR